MAGRVFNIGDLYLQRGVKLHMPPLTRKQDNRFHTLNQKEIRETRNISSLRIHVGSAIERM